MSKEIDFKLYKDELATRTFGFSDDNGGIYDFTGSTVILQLYLTSIPVPITGMVDLATGKVSFVFDPLLHTYLIGNFEYRVEETKADTTVVEILKGNIIIDEKVPFSNSVYAFLETELPATLTIDENYTQQRLKYWRFFLQTAAEITDENLEIDSAWGTKWNMLLAKLIVYDVLMLASTGSMIGFMGGSYTTTDSNAENPIKSIETGPTKVEFHSISKSVEEIFKTSSSGVTVWDQFQVTLCGLARNIGVKLPMCTQSKAINPIPVKYFQNADWDYPTLNEFIDDTLPSQG